MKKMTLLFPGSYMDYRKIDEDMQEEYRAAVKTGLYHTIIFNYDEWVAGGSLRMTEKEASSETYCAVYRGWMLKPEEYLRLFEELSDMHFAPPGGHRRVCQRTLGGDNGQHFNQSLCVQS